MPPFSDFPQSELEIVTPNGEVRSKTRGVVTNDQIIVLDAKADIEPGDEARRSLPNGKDETFFVHDVEFQQGMSGIPPFYTLKTSKKGSFPRRTGGHYSISVAGDHARINVGSHDQSTNVVNHGSTLSEVRAAIEAGIADASERKALVVAVERLAAAPDKSSAMQAYQALIAGAANHMTVLAPFLPALTAMVA